MFLNRIISLCIICFMIFVYQFLDCFRGKSEMTSEIDVANMVQKMVYFSEVRGSELFTFPIGEFIVKVD